MKKYIVTFLVIGTFGLYFLYQHAQGSPSVAIIPATVPVSASSKSGATTSATPSAAASTKNSVAVAPTTNQGQYKNGTYTGSVANAYWGPMQVAAVVKGGQLSAVQVLQYPQSHGTSVMINSEALPYLKSEAIQAQSASIDAVSGATLSSQAFQQSLASALTQATNG